MMKSLVTSWLVPSHRTCAKPPPMSTRTNANVRGANGAAPISGDWIVLAGRVAQRVLERGGSGLEVVGLVDDQLAPARSVVGGGLVLRRAVTAGRQRRACDDADGERSVSSTAFHRPSS
jgi:hypothetical protein